MLKKIFGPIVSKFIVDKVKDKLQDIVKDDEKTITEETQEEILHVKTELKFDTEHVISKELMEQYNFSSIPEPEIINPEGKKTAILVDDVLFTDIMYRSDLKKMKEQYNVDPYHDFKMVKCLGEYAGFQAYKYAVLEGNKVDIGVLDITLGHNFFVGESMCVEVDGIDIAYHIKQINPEFNFLLCTAHTLNTSNTTIERYNNKLKDGLDLTIKDCYLNKNSHRVDNFYLLLYGCNTEGNSNDS